MKNICKTLTLLALLLFGGMGAWAQNSWQSSSSQASNTVALADVTVTFNGDWTFTNDYAKGNSNGQTITIEPTADGDFMLVFGGSIGDGKPIHMMNNAEQTYVVGTKVGAPDVTVEGSGVGFVSGEGVVYALEAGVAYTFSVGGTKWPLASFSFVPAPSPEPAAIELTKVGANQWTLGSTPDYDLELQVEYYGEYNIDSIPVNWQVKVGNAAPVHPTAYTEGNTTLGYVAITETDSVELIPDNPRRVKSVTLVDASAPVVLTLDLATVTTETTVGDGYTVIGTLGANVQISIAEGATVTLDGVTINGVDDGSYQWAGINCLGDATIILSGMDTVKGFHDEYPGIYVPQNKTLTIQGSGSLTASSNGYACGIGGGYQIACGNIVIAGGTINANGGAQAAGIGSSYGSCGNISITGGTITATGGMGAAGIGSGSDGSCGNISITGGTVNATGGTQAAGIGSGFQGSCGTVTITNGVTSVTATKGNNATHSIGAGDSGSCNTVTIGGATGAISQSPYIYPQN